MYDINKFKKAEVIEINTKTWGLNLREYFTRCFQDRKLDGYILEFGVFRAITINILASIVPGEIVWGFDSFEGLPEEWKENDNLIRPKGFFKIDIPKVRTNVKLVKGFFDKSLSGWMELNKGDISFLHIDSDLYSSAKFIFDNLNDRIKVGTIIAFDEISDWKEKPSYQYWEEGEWKAFNEWLDEYDRDVEVICRTNRFQGAVKVIK